MFNRYVTIAVVVCQLFLIKSIVIAEESDATTITPTTTPTPSPPPSPTPTAIATTIPQDGDNEKTTIISTVLNPVNKSTSNTFELTLIHNNDMHARFDQANNVGNVCTASDAEAKKCYGGFGRIAHMVREEREHAKRENRAFLFLNAGDTFTGTPWFYLFKSNITVEFMNMLKPDAVSLGNHEFDENITLLEDYLNRVEFPVLAANLDFALAPELGSAKSISKYKIFEFDGVKVGVIGYITPDTKYLAPKNNVEFLNEIVVINQISAELKKSEVKIIIALGHSGIEQDKKIALHCEDVDVVVGGHSHTFLYSGDEPDSDKSEGPYPTIVKRDNGKDVIVLQCGALSKYLCMLNMTFDADGNLTFWMGKPYLLNSEVKQDADVVEALEKYRPQITEYEKTVIGKTDVLLDGLCRKMECNLGNMITDAMLEEYEIHHKEQHTDSNCSDVAIAFIQGGGIRSSISPGNISKLNLNSALPFHNPIVTMTLPGATIKAMLEHSVERYSNETAWGEFLQMSGVHVRYDLTKEMGRRVVYTEVRDLSCNATNYYPLNDTENYKIMLPKFLIQGGDGFDMLKEIPCQDFPLDDYAIVEKYMLRKKTAVCPLVQERIVFKNSGGKVLHKEQPKSGASNVLTSNVLLFICIIILNKFKY